MNLASSSRFRCFLRPLILQQLAAMVFGFDFPRMFRALTPRYVYLADTYLHFPFTSR